MAKMMVGGGLVISIAIAFGGCNIENCEQGAVCDDDDFGAEGGKSDVGVSSHHQTEQCLSYCDRLSICGAPQAKDFDVCVRDCKVRFDRLPEQTEELCSCISKSRCEDAIEGRCSHDSGSGGASGGSASGGSSSQGGAPSSGGVSSSGGARASGGSHASGGSQAAGGSHTSGGSSATGGTSGLGGSPNEGGAACGAAAGVGGSGDGAGASGAGGEAPGIACSCDCQCPSLQTCVEGTCAG